MDEQGKDDLGGGTNGGRSGHLRTDRRRFLVGAGLVGLVVAAGYGLFSRRSEVPLGPLSTVASDFPVRSIEDDRPAVPLTSWHIAVDGLVDHPFTIDAGVWQALPRADETRDFHCVEGWTVDVVRWGGVRLAEVLGRARPLPAAAFVTVHAAGGRYIDSLTLAESLDTSVLLADTIDGKPLPGVHGGPVRLVVPSQLGYKNVKWVTRLEVTNERAVGYWEQRGYPVEAPVGG